MHNADGSVKIRSFFYSAYTQRRYHKDSSDIPVGQHREADRWLEMHGVTDFCEIGEFLAAARLEGRLLFGVLIACLPEGTEP